MTKLEQKLIELGYEKDFDEITFKTLSDFMVEEAIYYD